MRLSMLTLTTERKSLQCIKQTSWSLLMVCSWSPAVRLLQSIPVFSTMKWLLTTALCNLSRSLNNLMSWYASKCLNTSLPFNLKCCFLFILWSYLLFTTLRFYFYCWFQSRGSSVQIIKLLRSINEWLLSFARRTIPDLFKSKHMYFCVENNYLLIFYLLGSVFKFFSKFSPMTISCFKDR